MEYTAKEIASLIQGEIEGNPDIKINNIAKIENGKEGALAFLANPKYAKYIYTTNASAIIVNKDFTPEKKLNKTLIRVENAYTAFAKLLETYQQQTKRKLSGIEKTSYIDETAKLGKDIYIGHCVFIGRNSVIGNNVKLFPHSYIGDNCIIGDNTTLYSGVKVYDESKIGNQCKIHAGAVIGADGFGFAPQENCDYQKVPQVGNVIIENNVEIGANTTIDRATIGSTILRKGAKLDNLIQVGHNVEIGENTAIAAQTGIAGSTKIGSDCLIGGQVGIIGHLEIADKVKIAAQSGISASIEEEGKIIQGSPAFDIRAYQKSYAIFRKGDEFRKQLMELEKKVHQLEMKQQNKDQ